MCIWEDNHTKNSDDWGSFANVLNGESRIIRRKIWEERNHKVLLNNFTVTQTNCLIIIDKQRQCPNIKSY